MYAESGLHSHCLLRAVEAALLRAPYSTTSTLSDIKVCLIVSFIVLALSRKVFYLSLKLTFLFILFHETFLPQKIYLNFET